MSESQHLSVIRIWAALAWADGVIAEPEAIAMQKLIDIAYLSAHEREIARGWLENRVELDTRNLAELSENTRLGIYRAAVRLAAVDLSVADEERAFLVRLRQGLDIADDIAEEIESSLPLSSSSQ